MGRFKFLRQKESFDCGETCIRMIAKYYGKEFSSPELKRYFSEGYNGTSLLELSRCCENIGFKTAVVRISFEDLVDKVPLPALVHWNSNHYVVVINGNTENVTIADPAFGKIKLNKEDFLSKWQRNSPDQMGAALLVEPLPSFYSSHSSPPTGSLGMFSLFKYLAPYRSLFIQIFLGMLAGGILQMFFPFMTQALVDKGIGLNDLNLIHLILIAQVVLLLSRLGLNVIQSRISLFVNGRISISLLSDFLIKLLNLPISFFRMRNTGDILQRIKDHSVIHGFISGTFLNLLFSTFNFFFFSIVLLIYSNKIFFIFIGFSILHSIWTLFFLRKRRELNYRFFDNSSDNQNIVLELIEGIQEIKLSNLEQIKRWNWERNQVQAYNLGFKSLNLGQVQELGSFFINESKSILITYITVISVLEGDITLGMMMSIQYILGALNGPINSYISLIQTLQDVKISLERIDDVYGVDNEDDIFLSSSLAIPGVDMNGIIEFRNVCYKYVADNERYVLDNISFPVSHKKITAIVGSSGSGKTTIAKLLLKLEKPNSGGIYFSGKNIAEFSSKFWRSHCSVVMQDGFIFSDTILSNVVLDVENFDRSLFENALRIAEISEFVNELHLKEKTVVGSSGHGLSQGQRQRILLARAVYRNTPVLILDEATNALDTKTEFNIMNNLKLFFKGRTVIVIAHRLSTIHLADNIIVLNSGRINESGSHLDLLKSKGLYFELVNKQLELQN